MSDIHTIQAGQTLARPQSNTLPTVTRVRLPQRLRNDGWWLCPAPERPSALILNFPKNLTPVRRSERPRHD